MLVTALSPVIGYDKAAQIAHYALEHDLSLKQAALKLGFVTEDEFDRIVDTAKMVKAVCRRRLRGDEKEISPVAHFPPQPRARQAKMSQSRFYLVAVDDWESLRSS
jgi:hypothetical protein